MSNKDWLEEECARYVQARWRQLSPEAHSRLSTGDFHLSAYLLMLFERDYWRAFAKQEEPPRDVPTRDIL